MGRWGHACIERVSTDNLVHMCRWDITRLNEGINLVNDELRAAKSHELLSRSELHRQGGHESLEQHRRY